MQAEIAENLHVWPATQITNTVHTVAVDVWSLVWDRQCKALSIESMQPLHLLSSAAPGGIGECDVSEGDGAREGLQRRSPLYIGNVGLAMNDLPHAGTSRAASNEVLQQGCRLRGEIGMPSITAPCLLGSIPKFRRL